MNASVLHGLFGNNKHAENKTELYRNLIRHEARIGGELFGVVASGVRREFFCLDERTWIWHEEWTDNTGAAHAKMTRYDVRPNGIFKAQAGQDYMPVNKQEAVRLKTAAEAYRKAIIDQLYSQVSDTNTEAGGTVS